MQKCATNRPDERKRGYRVINEQDIDMRNRVDRHGIMEEWSCPKQCHDVPRNLQPIGVYKSSKYTSSVRSMSFDHIWSSQRDDEHFLPPIRLVLHPDINGSKTVPAARPRSEEWPLPRTIQKPQGLRRGGKLQRLFGRLQLPPDDNRDCSVQYTMRRGRGGSLTERGPGHVIAQARIEQFRQMKPQGKYDLQRSKSLLGRTEDQISKTSEVGTLPSHGNAFGTLPSHGNAARHRSSAHLPGTQGGNDEAGDGEEGLFEGQAAHRKGSIETGRTSATSVRHAVYHDQTYNSSSHTYSSMGDTLPQPGTSLTATEWKTLHQDKVGHPAHSEQPAQAEHPEALALASKSSDRRGSDNGSQSTVQTWAPWCRLRACGESRRACSTGQARHTEGHQALGRRNRARQEGPSAWRSRKEG